MNVVRKMPVQKPGLSKQDYSTPRVFLDAVEKRFGELVFDLAATYDNTVAPRFFGPPGLESATMRTANACRGHDALAQDWTKLGGNLWLNPPFGHIDPWAAKCAASTVWSFKPPRKIFFLVPASVGSNWFADHVFNKARVLFLVGRLSFDGKAPYPKDCILAVYGEKPSVELWRWR